MGDHIRKRRFGLKLLQREVADQLGVDKTSVFNWEANTSNPEVLGYNPLPAASTMAEQLVRQRTSLGLSQKESARRIGVDPSTLAKWEQGKRDPTGVFLGRVKWFLDDDEERRSISRRVG